MIIYSSYFLFKGYSIVFSLFIFYSIRAMCFSFGEFPLPEPYLFFDPGFPSIFVPYDATNDLFFSGHIGLLLLITLNAYYDGHSIICYISFIWIFYTGFMMCLLGGHYFNDLILGVIVAITVVQAVKRY